MTSITRYQDGTTETSTSRFLVCDDDGAEIDNDGRATRALWTDLQAHASFPADRTTVSHQAIETPLGRLDCLHYTVDRGDAIDEFWFAEDIPGMPVRYRTTVDGTVISETNVVSNDLP